jgi:hypothetical protein
VGATPGQSQYFDSGNLGSATSTTVTGLPTDGRTVFARLFFRAGSSGNWQSVDAAYDSAATSRTVDIVASSYSVSMSEATLGGGLAGSTVAFLTWDGSSGLPIGCSGDFCEWNSEFSPATIGGGTYRADYLTFDSLGIYEDGTVSIQVPASDSNGNDMPDVLELSRSGGFAFSGSSQCHFNLFGNCFSSTLSGTVSRAAGSLFGSYSGSYTIQGTQVPFSGSMRIERAEGTGQYEVGGDTISISAFAVSTGSIFQGSAVLIRLGTNQIQLPVFTLTESETGLSVTTSATTTLTRNGSTYQGLLTFIDGGVETAWADYRNFLLEITDNNDTDGDGIPDLSDPSP